MYLPDQYPMNSLDKSLHDISAPSVKSRWSYGTVPMVGDLLLLCDFVCLLFAAFFSLLFYTHWLVSAAPAVDYVEIGVLVAAVLAPFILYEKRFGALASRGHLSILIRTHVLRFMLFAGVVLLLVGASPVMDTVPRVWLALWLFTGLLSTLLLRIVISKTLQLLQRRGVLTEVIAVVGGGPVADRLVEALHQTRPHSIELLGVFDDKIVGATPGTIKSSGNIAQLIELGKTRKIDWILLTLPPAEQRVLSIVQRLKSLSVPIGLCPQHVGLSVPYRTIDYVGNHVPVSLLADRPIKRWDIAIKMAEDFLPRWTITLALLPLAAINALVDKFAQSVRSTTQQPGPPLALQFDNYDTAGFTSLASRFGQNRYGYAVTPNADHIIRLHESAAFRALYASASYVLLDSRFLSHVLRFTKGIQLPVCTGSDLTAALLSDVITPNDRLVLIGGNKQQARQLRERYGLQHLAHFIPPMGFIHDPQAVETCLQFIESHSPFRFCFLAVGAPQQEAVAQQLKTRGVARGLALCIGASINFLTGVERRAPLWMQYCGIEWLFRLLQAPGRMARRYLVRGPRVFGLLHHAKIGLRETPSAPVFKLITAPQQPAAMPVFAAESEPASEPAYNLEPAERKHRAVNAPI